MRGYGIPLDFSPASLLGLDAYLDTTVGPEGYAPNAEEWAPDPAQQTLVLLYGSYLGEVVRRRIGGAWQEPRGGDDALGVHLLLPDGSRFFPFARLFERLRVGVEQGLMRAFDDLVGPLSAGRDVPADAPHWMSMGDAFVRAGQRELAERFFARARSMKPASDQPAPIEQPASEKPARVEKPACEKPAAIEKPASAPPPSELPPTPRISMPVDPPRIEPVRIKSVPPPSLRTLESLRPITAGELETRRTQTPADLAADSVALALAGDADGVSAMLAENREHVGTALGGELATWAEHAAKETDERARADAADAIATIAERIDIIGDPATAQALLERAVRVLGPTLTVTNRSDLLRRLALVQADGSGPNRLEDAITVLDAAVRLLDPRTSPDAWARVHESMATVHLRRATTRKDALEAAIGALHQVTRVRNKKDHPAEWGEAQRMLGQALRSRVGGDRQKNLDDAISAFRAAIDTLEPGSASWGAAKQGLGIGLMTTPTGDRNKNAEDAIALLEESLTALSPGSAAASRSHYQVGLAYQRRKAGERGDNLARAAEHYRASAVGIDTDGTGERQSLVENLDAAEREIRKLKTS